MTNFYDSLGINGGLNISANSTTDAIYVSQLGTGNAMLIEDSANPDLTPFIINSGGSVNIGRIEYLETSSGTKAKLQVNNSTSQIPFSGLPFTTNFIVQGFNNNNIGFFTTDVSTSQLYFGTPSSVYGAKLSWYYTGGTFDLSTQTTGGTLTFGTDQGIERMRILSNGNVGIGTTAATETLTVNGSIGATTISGGTFYGDGSNLTGISGGGSIIYSAGTGTCSVVRIGVNNIASGNCSIVSGGVGNTASGDYSTVSGGAGNTSINSIVGGGRLNTSNNGTISGGYCNFADGSFIGGGDYNTASGSKSTIAGGLLNKSLCSYSTISGGYFNTVSGDYSVLSGGRSNTISGEYSTIGGGFQNKASGQYSTISGGIRNTELGDYSIIGSGSGNTINNQFGGVLGGRNNKVINDCSFIIGNGITSTAANTTHVNCLHISNIPTSSAGLAPGTVWNNGGVLNIV